MGKPIKDDDLLAQAERLERAVNAGIAVPHTHAMLVELMAGIRAHFDDEEAQMERAGYPDVREHKRKHHVLRGKLIDLALQVRSPDPAPAKSGATELMRVLLDHFAKDDAKLFEFMNPMPRTASIAK